MNRRAFLGAVAIAVALSVGCRGADVADDPKYAPLPGPGDVDDAWSSRIPGDRAAAIYVPDDAIRGAATPLVTIVEYSDFQCPFCGQAASTLDEMIAAYPDDVRVVFKHFPLAMHPDAGEGAKAAIAAGRQGRFWAMHDRLFAQRTAMKTDDLVAHAKAIGLDVDKFTADLADAEVEARLQADRASGQALGVRGTPTLFVNGIRIGGAPKPDILRDLVDDERKVAETLIASGGAREEVYARILRKAGAHSR